ncbi:FAD:protein FMN transferase [Reichenbachiella versicolor]|uniref:FAD:protein FMN transferase n=1 Tax=Reichenbachiella versicolor TaxID=1821036 RepID=UPI000D6E129A|nr:FAD:protein FMN transferase [Reichenbachiella versicolor]
MQKRRILIILLAVGVLVIWKQIHQPKEEPLQHLTGTTMGPIPYSIKYVDNRDLQSSIDSLLNAFNESLSTYISYSELSMFNKTNKIQFRSPFIYPVMEMSKEAFEMSNGAFDPTVGPLVNAWGFGKDKSARIDSLKIDSLLQFVGYDKVTFDQSEATKPDGFFLDFSASAKGYAIDLVADMLRQKQIHDFMIEIGGEVICSGKNKKNKTWKIGINEPSLTANKSALFATTFLQDKAMATSGNYRNYHMSGDKIVAHTINPKTGYSEVRNLLSATVFAENCTMADAYATACMVLGVQESIKMLERIDGVDGFLIYTDDNGKFQWYTSPAMINQIEVLD